MKWRAVSLTTGEKIRAPKGKDYLLNSDGEVFVLDENGKIESRLLTLAGYSVDFAFERDSNGKWIWSHSVVND